VVISTEQEVVEIRPQPRQELFLASSADIVIYGGAAGGGKTWSLLLEPLRHIGNPDFGAVIFRRTIPEITKEGALWDEAGNIYPLLNGKPNKNDHYYLFPSGAKVSFAHLQYETTLREWRGAQIALIEFDQLETFSEKQFFYMLSRNRSTCGVQPYIRASCNPEPGWLADFLAWWIDDEGYAILERSGKIRWMVRENDVTYWSSTREELAREHPNSTPKSVTFVVSTVYDNEILLSKDPSYLANLQALSYVDRARLLGDRHRGGNWKIVPAAGKVFNKSWFEIVNAAPAGMTIVRFWDLAATTKKIKKDDPDFTASVKMGKKGGNYYILDCTADQIDPGKTDRTMKNQASQDGPSVAQRWEQEGGASGKRDNVHIASNLAGYDGVGVPPQGDKITRAKALAAQSLAGNVKLLRGPWNEMWLNHMHGQPDLPHDDIMDASSGAFNELVTMETDWRGAGGEHVEEYTSPWR
jgi:predicted phage terminase large subunit-like protein